MRTHWAHMTLVAAVVLTSGAAEAGWNEGIAAFNAGQYDTAVKEFRAVVEAYPDSHQAHFMLGRSYLEQKSYPQALAHLRKAYDLDPMNLTTMFFLGSAFFGAGRYQDAAVVLSNIESHPGSQSKSRGMLEKAMFKSGQRSPMPCPEAVRTDQDSRASNTDWLTGYFAFRNHSEDADIGEGFEPTHLYSLALDHCKKNSSSDWHDAVRSVYQLYKDAPG